MSILILIILFCLFIATKSESPNGPRSSGPIIGTGRSPMYYDIMDEAYAEHEEELRKNALTGKMVTRTSYAWADRNNPSKHKIEQISSQQVYDEFLEWKANGYM